MRKYWEKVCEDYEREVVSVWDRDAEGKVSSWIERLSDPTASAADLGCGVGKFLPLLSASFAEVEACDFTRIGLQKSGERCANHELGNVNLHRFDLTCDIAPFEPVELVLCVNVLLMASYDERMRSWRTVTKQVRSGGWLLLVVPAVESILMQQHLERDEMLGSGTDCETSVELSLPEGSKLLDLHQGVHRVEGFPTKHYLKSELRHLLESHHFEIQEIERLSYGLLGIQSAGWDWFAVAKRKTVA